MEFDLENPLRNFQDLHSDSDSDSDSDTISSLFLIESDRMVSENYSQILKAGDFDVSVRREAVSSILQLSCSFDPFISYLAVDYLDRFLSTDGFRQRKPWILRLLSMSCVSLAAKMKKTELSLTDFQGDGGFIFDTQTIQKMELLILGALKWRMRSVTPFSFLTFFISLFKLKDPPLKQAIKSRATEILFEAQNDIKLLEFKPSILSASALLYASHELLPLQFPCFRKAISNCSYVNKENMLRCYNAMQEIAVDGYESVLDMASSDDTAVNVLDQHFSSSESEKTTMTITALRLERDTKRRKISGYYTNQTVQISQIQQLIGGSI